MSEHLSFPLFPLEIVVLPTELVPLHIFEPRYKTMIGVCIEAQSEFGIICATEDGQEIGCAVEIADVLERMDDGRINIVCRGTRPFRVLDRTDGLEYPAGTIEFLDDDPEVLDEIAAETSREQYAQLVERATDAAPEDVDLDAMTAYAMAARVDFGAEAKQSLLALRSENARLRLLTRLLRAVNKRLEHSELISERARMNGKVRFD
jgi:Lon protease-like protein